MTSFVPPATARIRFRRYRDSDAAAVAKMFDDPEAQRFYPEFAEPGAGEHWIRWNRENYERHGFGLWALEHAKTGTFLGDCGLTYQAVAGRSLLEVGYHLDVSHRGKGFATEAGLACIEFAFDEVAVDSICSIVDPANVASIAVASRLHGHRTTCENDDGRIMLLFTTNGAEFDRTAEIATT